MNRRDILCGAGTIGIASLAGCLGVAGLDEHFSEPAGVEQRVLDETGYEQTDINEIKIEEEVNFPTHSENIMIVNYLTEYEKEINMGPLGRQRGAVFTLFTTPQVNIIGREFNPVRDMNTRELVELVEGHYGNINDITHQSDDGVTVLNQDTTRSTFKGETQINGYNVDLNLHITEAVERNNDLFVTIGGYPEQVQIEEEDNIISLIENVVEQVDETNNGNSTVE